MPFALGVSEASLENEHGVTSAMNVLAKVINESNGPFIQYNDSCVPW